jgi:glycosyltransferase involved in cell wall biosynthesis
VFLVTGPPSRFTSDAITVIMAVRDREHYVGEAIESILAQTAPPGDVVVVDDGSQDGTPDVLRGFGAAIRVLRQDPHNQFVATNHAIGAATTPLLAFLDSDDRYTPVSLAARLDRMNADDEPEAVFGRIEQFISPELSPDAADRLRWLPGPQQVELMQAMMIRRSAMLRVGPLVESLRTSANVEWISRSRAAALRSAFIDDVVVERRLHATNIGITEAERKRRDLLDVVRRHRRRTSSSDHPADD